VISPARRAAYHVLCRVELAGAFSDQMLNSRALAGVEDRDRNLATEICYGTLRWQLSLDAVLSEASARPWDNVEARVRILLRMSLYQLWRTQRVPDHAVVNDAVEIAKIQLDRAKAGFVNGLLRNLCRSRPWDAGDLAKDYPPWVRASIPKWLWDRWSVRYGDDLAFRYAVSLNQSPQAAVWAKHPQNSTASEGENGVPSKLVPGAYLVDKTTRNEGYWPQDEASQLVPHLLAAKSGWRVWDACAAPGGKAAILGDLCRGMGLVVASDVSRARVTRMNRAFDGLASTRPAVLIANAEKGIPFRDGQFDAVLADVPCSGLGTLRRNPEIKWRFQPGRFPGLQRRQSAILDSVCASVRPGGVLLYSTCSTEPEENEEVVKSFLDRHTAFRLISPESPPGVEQWLDSEHFLRTFPSERGWDGFFAAIMRRFA
jgi:16S rRNA (cytosine967-C5)-methyltransferase